MVKKTRRASKISKRRKNNTRSRRGRGRGHRTVKRGGMMKHAAHTSRAAHAAAAHVSRVSSKRIPHTTHNPTEEPSSHNFFGYKPDPKKGELALHGYKYFETPGHMPPNSGCKDVGVGLKEKFEDPVEMFGAFTAGDDAAKKAQYNEQLHYSLQNRTPGYQAKFAHFTPSAAGRESMYGYPPNYVYNTPAGASSDLQSPPPPTDLSVRGTGIPVMYNNSVGFAPGAPGAPPAGLVRNLHADFDMLPAPLPPGPAAVFPVAPVDASPQRSDFMSSNPPNTFPRANRNSMNRMNCNKISGSP